MASLAMISTGVLVGEVVAALDGVEGVPLPVVFLHVRQCGTHAALGRAGVAAGGVELGQYGRAGTGASFDCRTHACATGADDDHVITMFLHEVCAPLARRDIGVEGEDDVRAQAHDQDHRENEDRGSARSAWSPCGSSPR